MDVMCLRFGMSNSKVGWRKIYGIEAKNHIGI